MKKFRMGKRLMAGLLALIMIVSIIPLNVFAAIGDITSGKTGLDTNINTLDTISWPIKVYDYLNDGMLFEYASSSYTTISDLNGDAYGGGEMMPGELYSGGMYLGNDYTVNSSETDIYDRYAYTDWLKAQSGYESDVAQQGVGTKGAFKFLRLQPCKDYKDLYNSNVPSLVVSDFKRDSTIYSGESTSYAKDRVRYAVLIYRTNMSNLKVTMGVSDSKGSKTVLNYNLATYKDSNGGTVKYDQTQTVTLTKDMETWKSVIVDMNSGTAATRWNNGTAVTQIIMDTNMATEDQYMDLSHIAYFSTELEALRFAEIAVAFSNNPGEYLPDQSYKENGTTKYKHWNMGNNNAFTMLYASSGGGWSGVGGTNSWANGYFSYQLGEHTGTGTKATNVNSIRNTAKNAGYPVPDDIFHYSVSSNSSHDLSKYDFGYTLFNTITTEDFSSVMTAGLLQSDLISVVGVDGKTYRIPQYKSTAVEYMAVLLANTLSIGQKDKYGNYNYNFVKGSVSSQFADANGNKRDLASALREALGMKAATNNKGNYTLSDAASKGSYVQSKERQELLIGPYQQVIAAFKAKGLTFTYFDAAYYLMHNLFVADSYNQLQDDYNYLVLSKATVSSTGREAYVFDAGFTTGNGTADSQSGVVYNENNGTISLNSAVGKDQIYYSSVQKTTRYPFLPVQHPEGDYQVDSYYNSNGTPYFEDDGALGVTDYGETYAGRDYNYVLQANAEFVYHYQDDLFFEFQGDDDVYLFVNGELVLDIGAAHAITSVNFNMNEYVLQAQKELSFLKQNYGYRATMSDEQFEEVLNKAVAAGAIKEADKAGYRRWHHLNLVDSKRYTIDFYYMERHGWGANMRVATNILMTDPTMITDKKAYQDGAEIKYGGIVDETKRIEYGFCLTNEGENKLYNLTFNDYAIGVSLSPEKGLSFMDESVNGVTVCDARGQKLEANDLVVWVDGYKDEEKTKPVSLRIRFDGQDPNGELKQFLRDLTSNDGTDDEITDDLFAGSGLWRHATVTIRGIYYKMTPEQIADEQFNNTVFTTANPAVDSDLVLNSADIHQVRLIGDARHIYQWREHDVYFTRDELVNWLGGSVKLNNRNYTASQIKITTCRKDGTTFDFPDIVVRNNNQAMTVNYWDEGTQLFFIKIFRDTNNDGNPDDLNSDGKLNETDYMIVPLAVFVTDLKDDAIVLDYGLKAELTAKGGIVENDYIVVPNLHTGYSIMGMSQSAPSYLSDISNLSKKNYNRISFAPVEGQSITCSDGTYEYTVDTDDDKLYFTPSDFMDEEYTVYIAVTVHELDTYPNSIGVANGTTVSHSIDITKEVQMYQKVTVLPASVMYYEDDFLGLLYEHNLETLISGTGSSAVQQGVDQSVNYGADQNYQTKDNAQFSGNSMTAVQVTKNSKLAQFSFVGTGFEIVGRTNAFDSASLVVYVKDNKQSGDLKLLPAVSATQLNNVYNFGTKSWSSKAIIYLDTSGIEEGTWEEPYAQFMNESGDMIMAPGVRMQGGQNGRYSVTVPYGAQFVVFNDCTTSQTEEQTLQLDEGNLFDGSEWSVYDPGEAEQDDDQEESRMIYFDNSTIGWGEVYLYVSGMEDDQTDEWPGTKMIRDEDEDSQIYSIELPEGATEVIFNDGVGIKRSNMQTLPLGLDLYKIVNDSWRATKSTRTIYLNVDDTWTRPYAYYWSEQNKEMIVEPGAPMTLVADGTYKIEIPESATGIRFTNILRSLPVITEFNNADASSCKHTNHNQSGHCTVCGTYVGHAYYEDVCSVCGQNRLDYYLVGFINGADYGCEGDYENMGQYKFVNGKLTATFKTDGYVMVKTTGNASYFMTDGYPGANVTSTYLYNTNTPELQADKLHVPGGVELTFTLVENVDGTLTLSYTTSNDDLTDFDKTVYFNNTDDWSQVYAYYWSNTDATMVDWPGVAMTRTTETDPIYVMALPSDAEYVIFTDGTGNQTMDLTVPAHNMVYSFSGFNKGWSVYNPGKTTLSFDNSVSKWSKVYIHYWSEQDKQMVEWPGVEMPLGADNVYTIAIPSNATNVLFHNGDGTQTADLDVLKNGDTYIYGTGWASKDGGDTVRTVYFKNTANWNNLHVHYWEEGSEGNLVAWPGDAMIQQDGDIFKASISADATHVVFNNGSDAAKTLNLKLEDGLNLFVYDQVAAETVPTGSWSVYGTLDIPEEPEVVTSRTVYLINNGNWATPYAHYWADGGESTDWPGVKMTKVEGNLYSVTVSLEADYIIFNVGSNATQTANLPLIDGLDTYNYQNNTWSSVETKTIYLENNTGWTTPFAYFWFGDNSTKLSIWPGVQMTKVQDNRYSVTVPAIATKIIFNNGSGTQTADLSLTAGNDLYNLGTDAWSGTGIQEETPITTRGVYYNNNKGWEKVYVYYWALGNESMTTWPGVEMTADENGIYGAQIPTDARYVIFNDNAGNQTTDLTVPNNANFYSVPNASCGTWEQYEAQRILYFDAGSSGWSQVNAYYWATSGELVTWPGEPMTKVGDTLYSITVPYSAEKVIFNNGSGDQTADLTITDANDKYSYNAGLWFKHTRVIYFEGSQGGSVRLTYSGEGVAETKKIMTRMKNNIYRCEIPMDSKYVTFEDGMVVTGPVILSDDHDFYTDEGWSVFDPAADYRSMIYFKNTQDWENVFIHYWGENVNATAWPGVPMTFMDDRIYVINIPVGVEGVVFNNGDVDGIMRQTADLTLSEGDNLFTMAVTGNSGTWSQYTRNQTDAIHQVPTLRVDGLELGEYTVEIHGMPTYTDDVDWSHMQDFVKTTYLYLDGIRIYQPLGSTHEHYMTSENGATVTEMRNLILEGHAAVAIYDHGTTTYTGNVSWTENRNGTGGDMETVYLGNQLSGIDDYLLLGPNNETYLNGNAQTQALIFYVKETEGKNHALQIAARGIDAGLFLGNSRAGVNATLYHGVYIENPDGSIGYGWRPMDTVLSGTEQYYTVKYEDCPYFFDENNEKIYQVALFVRSGMVSFTNVKFVGLDLQSRPVGDATELKMYNGTILVEDEESGIIGGSQNGLNKIGNNLFSISSQMVATQWIEDEKQDIVLKYPALSFEDEIFYNVFFTLPELTEQPVEMGLLIFDTLEEDGTIYDAAAVISGVTEINGMYVARSEGVQAKDLGKTMYFRVFAQMSNGTYIYSKAAHYSVRQYAKAVLEGNYNAETKALIAAMLQYNEAARKQFGGVETLVDLLSEDVRAMVTDYSPDLLPNATKPDVSKAGYFAATATGFAKKAPAVSFDGAFAINFFFTPSTTVQGNMTLYYWNAEDYEAAGELTTQNATGSMVMTPGDRYTAAITGIAAKDLDSTYYVAVVYQSNGQTYCSGVLAYSLATYCNSKATAEGTISDLAKATAVYGYHAKQLFG